MVSVRGVRFLLLSIKVAHGMPLSVFVFLFFLACGGLYCMAARMSGGVLYALAVGKISGNLT